MSNTPPDSLQTQATAFIAWLVPAVRSLDVSDPVASIDRRLEYPAELQKLVTKLTIGRRVPGLDPEPGFAFLELYDAGIHSTDYKEFMRHAMQDFYRNAARQDPAAG
jgi:hypothetical protein